MADSIDKMRGMKTDLTLSFAEMVANRQETAKRYNGMRAAPEQTPDMRQMLCEKVHAEVHGEYEQWLAKWKKILFGSEG